MSLLSYIFRSLKETTLLTRDTGDDETFSEATSALLCVECHGKTNADLLDGMENPMGTLSTVLHDGLNGLDGTNTSHDEAKQGTTHGQFDFGFL